VGGEPLACDGRVRGDVGVLLLVEAVGVGEGVGTAAVGALVSLGAVDAGSEDGSAFPAG
jgi:hypothetical protein